MTFKEKHQNLLAEIQETLQILIYHNGETSQFNGEKCLIPDEDYMFNVGSSWIMEVHADKVLTPYGTAYQFSTLSTYSIVELADHLMKKYG